MKFQIIGSVREFLCGWKPHLFLRAMNSHQVKIGKQYLFGLEQLSYSIGRDNTLVLIHVMLLCKVQIFTF